MMGWRLKINKFFQHFVFQSANTVHRIVRFLVFPIYCCNKRGFYLIGISIDTIFDQEGQEDRFDSLYLSRESTSWISSAIFWRGKPEKGTHTILQNDSGNFEAHLKGLLQMFKLNLQTTDYSKIKNIANFSKTFC